MTDDGNCNTSLKRAGNGCSAVHFQAAKEDNLLVTDLFAYVGVDLCTSRQSEPSITA